KSREKVVVQSKSKGSDDEDISDLKKITTLLAKAFNRKKYYAKSSNNNLRTSSASSLANKKPEYVKLEDKKADEKRYEQNQEINANIVFMAKMEKVLSDSEEFSSSIEETIAEVSYYSSDSERCSKHMMGNRALLTNIVENFLGTFRFGNNDFTVIAGYGDVVIGSVTIKKVYYVEDGVDLLSGDRSSNLYTIALNDIALNSSACLLAKASSSQSWLRYQHHLCSACEQGKIHWKHLKSKTTFPLNKPLYLLHMDLCGPMCVKSINGKRYVLVVVDDYSRYTWVFFLHSKDEASEAIISFIKKTQVNLQLQVQRVRIDNGVEFKSKTLATFFDEVGISQQFFLQERHIKMVSWKGGIEP
nr:hypothetical protein [Tanacetum cinerariifolium]